MDDGFAGVEGRDGMDDPFAGLDASVDVPCPYCGEIVELVVDPGGGVRQDYVEDCEVCCRPWRIRLTFQRDGSPVVDVATLDDT